MITWQFILCKSNLYEAIQSMEHSNAGTDGESGVDNTKNNENNNVVNKYTGINARSITIAIKNKHFDCVNVLCKHPIIILKSLDNQSAIVRDNVQILKLLSSYFQIKTNQ